MRTWLRSVVDTILGRVPSKASRLDTATRMVMDADFGYRPAPTGAERPQGCERDDGHLIKSIGPSRDRALFEQLVRIVNEAQERDAKDERRLIWCKGWCLAFACSTRSSIPGYDSR